MSSAKRTVNCTRNTCHGPRQLTSPVLNFVQWAILRHLFFNEELELLLSRERFTSESKTDRNAKHTSGNMQQGSNTTIVSVPRVRRNRRGLVLAAAHW